MAERANEQLTETVARIKAQVDQLVTAVQTQVSAKLDDLAQRIEALRVQVAEVRAAQEAEDVEEAPPA